MTRIKQSFSFQWNDDRVFGCSFTIARNGQYFGRVSEYPNRDTYNGIKPLKKWKEYKNIPLETEPLPSLIALKEFCKKL